MYSSSLSSIPTSAKYGASKQPDRFAIRVYQPSSSPPFPYTTNPTWDFGYRPPSEQAPPEWYGKSAFNGPYNADYPAYANVTNPPLIYEQPYSSKPSHVPDFDDASSMGTFSAYSPALSTDSTETLKSPVDSESSIDELEASALSLRSTHSVSGPATSQAIAISRSSSSHDGHTPDIVTPHIYHPFYSPYVADDTASTVSEFEVEERDRIAKANAEYNSISSTRFRRNPVSSRDVGNNNDLHQVPSGPPRHSSSNQPGFSRLTSGRPLHPDLHFPPRALENANGTSSYAIYASRDGTPPSVERVPSYLPIEDIRIHASPEPSQSPPLSGSRADPCPDDLDSNSSRGWNQRLPPVPYPTKNSPTIRSSTYPPYNGGVHITIPDPPPVNEVEQRKHYPYFVAAPSQDRNVPENETSNVITNNGQDDDTKLRNDDKLAKLQYIYQTTTPSTSSDNSRSHKNSSTPHSSPRKQVSSPSDVDEKARAAVGMPLRNDTRTPVPQQRDRTLNELEPVRQSPSSRPLPATRANPDSPSRSLKDVRSGAHTREDDVSKPQRTAIPSDNTYTTNDIIQDSSYPSRSHMVDVVRQPSSKLSRQLAVASDMGHKRGAAYEAKYGTDPARETDKELVNVQHPRNGSSPPHLSSSKATESSPESGRKAVECYSEREEDRRRVNVNVRHSAYVSREGEAALYSQPGVHGSHKPHFHDNQQSSHPPSVRLSESPRNDGRLVSPGTGSTQHDKHSSPSAIKAGVDSCQATAAPHAPLEHRRYSDGDQATPPIRPPLSGRSSAPLSRSVRWTDNLIAPSPVFAPPKRKGWFNRRGDQLWTNDGAYMPTRKGEEYPLDLDDYPEYGEGWMNEDGIRIDVDHRRIPKSPPRSALKASIKS